MEFSVDSIPMLSTIMAQGNTLERVGTSILDSQLDLAFTQMDGLTKMMELSVNPNLGANFDMSI